MSLDLDHLKRLAMLELSADEEAEVRRRLSKILEYLGKLRSLDLSGVEPMYAAGEAEASYRPDVPESRDPDEVLRVVPRRKDRYVRGPRMA